MTRSKQCYDSPIRNCLFAALTLALTTSIPLIIMTITNRDIKLLLHEKERKLQVLTEAMLNSKSEDVRALGIALDSKPSPVTVTGTWIKGSTARASGKASDEESPADPEHDILLNDVINCAISFVSSFLTGFACFLAIYATTRMVAMSCIQLPDIDFSKLKSKE